jgi:hypothetical protein
MLACLLLAGVWLGLFDLFDPQRGHRHTYLIPAIMVLLGGVGAVVQRLQMARKEPNGETAIELLRLQLMRLQFNILLWLLIAGLLVGLFGAIPPWKHHSLTAYLAPAIMVLIGGTGVALQWKQMTRPDPKREAARISLAVARAKSRSRIKGP